MTTASRVELTFRALGLGLVIGFFFALGNVYLGLRSGITVSASIPAAVISLGLLRLFAKRASILEANMVQTVASAGEAVATGAVFTVPALLFLGEPLSLMNTFAIGVLGSALGILWIVPLRHALIVVEAKRLPYPEGTACAKLLEVKDAPKKGSALLCIWGTLFGEAYKILTGLVHLWPERVSWTVHRVKSFALDTTPALLGIGYIIGTRYALTLFAGGFFTWWGLIPLISLFETGASPGLPIEVSAPTLTAEAIWTNYIRYVGTGALAASGVVSLIRFLPVIGHSLYGHVREMVADIFSKRPKRREERDLPFYWVLLGTLVIVCLLLILPGFHLSAISTLLLIVLGIFFVALTAIITGVVGTSTSPVSGLIIFVLVVTGLLFLALDWTTRAHLLMAITLGSVLGVGIATAGDCVQDLKTGHLVGATPALQQVAMMIGVLIPSLTVGWAINLLNENLQIGSEELPAPQATLVYLVIDGILEQKIPILICVTGAVIGLVVELLGVLSLPFALGIFLPFATTTAIGVGGVLAFVMNRWLGEERAKRRGILFGSGLIAGDALTGIVVALVAALGWIDKQTPDLLGPWVSLLVYLLLLVLFAVLVGKNRLESAS